MPLLRYNNINMANSETLRTSQEDITASPAHRWGMRMRRLRERQDMLEKSLVRPLPAEGDFVGFDSSGFEEAIQRRSEELAHQLAERLEGNFPGDGQKIIELIYGDHPTKEAREAASNEFADLFDKYLEKKPDDAQLLAVESIVPYYWGILTPHRDDKPQS